MRSILKYLFCFCAVLCGVATLQAHYANAEAGSAATVETQVCPNLSVQNILQESHASISDFIWIGREKSTMVFRVSMPERRENEEDDEYHPTGSRLGTACISSIFHDLASQDILSRILVAYEDDHIFTHSSRYLIFQVFRLWCLVFVLSFSGTEMKVHGQTMYAKMHRMSKRWFVSCLLPHSPN